MWYNRKSKYEKIKSEWMKVRFLTDLTPEQEAEFNTFYQSIKNTERVDIFIACRKISDTIHSCTTEEHFVNTDRMIQNFHFIYQDQSDETNCTKILSEYSNQMKQLILQK